MILDAGHRPWLNLALHSLWFQAVATQSSGALALLEPRVSEGGPRVRSDGRFLWVDDQALEGWLSVPDGAPDGMDTLAAAGLEVLYAWRGEPGPWVSPYTPIDPVLEVGRSHAKGDWLRERLMGSHKRVPQEGWLGACWWDNESDFLGSQTVGIQQVLSPPPHWSPPLEIQTLEQAQTAWWRAVRLHRASKHEAMPDSEQAWIARCLEERADELKDWMSIQPPPKVPYDGLFHLADPDLITGFLSQGAAASAESMGQTAVAKAAGFQAHMVIPLLECGVEPGMPLEELLMMLATGHHPSPSAIKNAVEAGLGLMQIMAKTGQPMDWSERANSVASLLPKSMNPNQSRILILEGLWPNSLRLDRIIPVVETTVGRNGRSKNLPLAHAIGVWTTQAIEGKGASSEDLSMRLHAFDRMGVDFSHVGPKGGVFHEALLCARQPSTPEKLYSLLEPMGANWEAKNKRGEKALGQKEWETNDLKKRLRESFYLDVILARQLEKKMEQGLDKGAPEKSSVRRF